MLRVVDGRLTVRPSSSSLMMIWQPRREVWVRPKARSSMSSSSSLAFFSSSYHSGSTMTWQVEQASEPSQAPSISMPFLWAISSTERPSGASTSRRLPSRSMKITLGMRNSATASRGAARDPRQGSPRRAPAIRPRGAPPPRARRCATASAPPPCRPPTEARQRRHPGRPPRPGPHASPAGRAPARRAASLPRTEAANARPGLPAAAPRGRARTPRDRQARPHCRRPRPPLRLLRHRCRYRSRRPAHRDRRASRPAPRFETASPFYRFYLGPRPSRGPSAHGLDPWAHAGGTPAVLILPSNVERLAAAAAALFVRVAEDKARLELLLDVIHLGAEDEHDGLGVNEDRHALVLDDFVEFALLVGVFDRIAEPRAAPGAHADAHPQGRLAAPGQQRLDPRCRGIRHHQSLLARHHSHSPGARYRRHRPFRQSYVGGSAPSVTL